MGPLDTKLLIADAFVELCDEMPLKKVSISDIVERTGKNRKTFYYHFVDKEALIIWRFRYDLGLALQRKFPESILVYDCLLYTSPSPRDYAASRMPSSA